MSALKEFNELHPNIKTVCIGLALLMPFWYLDIYLFSRIPIDKNIQIPIVISFCLSICWFALNTATYVLFITSIAPLPNSVRNANNYNKLPENNYVNKKDSDETFEYITFISVVYLALTTLIGYLAKIPFHKLIYINFAFGAFRAILYVIIHLFRMRAFLKK